MLGRRCCWSALGGGGVSTDALYWIVLVSSVFSTCFEIDDGKKNWGLWAMAMMGTGGA